MGAARTLTTLADLARVWDDAAVELVNGELTEKAAPSFEHGDVQSSLAHLIRTPFARRGGGGMPGGWWIASEVDVALGADVIRPDLAGWRRERVPTRPVGRPVPHRPDWIAEVLSPSTARHDLVVKLRVLQREGVPHYWMLDTEREILTVYRHNGSEYVVALVAGSGERVRAEPFDAVELDVTVLFGGEPTE